MDVIAYVFVFGIGLSAGSFVNALVFRLEKGKSLFGRSQCPHCGHELSWAELVPVLSFLFLGGTCKACKEKISFQYPLVELATALLFLGVFAFAGENFVWSSSPLSELNLLGFVEIGILFGIATLLVAIFLYDLKHMLIPDVLLYPSMGLAFLWQLRLSWLGQGGGTSVEPSFLDAFLAAAGAALFFWFLHWVSKGRAMGFGDVKLAFFMGLFLGFSATLVALWIAFTLGALVGIGLVVLKKRGMRSQVPFGPFLIAGTFLAFLWGGEIAGWYLRSLVV